MIDRLPAYVARAFAKDLQCTSLKDIQPRISENMESILQEINAQEEVHVQFSRSKFPKRKDRYKRNQNRDDSRSSKTCPLCKAAGRQFSGHDAASCWFISKFDKLEIAKALQVKVDHEVDSDEDSQEETVVAAAAIEPPIMSDTTVSKVQCDVSPYLHVFYKHMPFVLVVDSGANSSMVARSFLKKVGIAFKPTLNSARTVDRRPIGVLVEVKFSVHFGELELPLTALVMENLDCDILGGTPFCKENDVSVHFKQEEITIQNIRVPYGTKRPSKPHDIYRVESFVLRNDQHRVLMPGECVEIECDNLYGYDDEISIEPHSIINDEDFVWPDHSITRVI